MDMSKKQTGLDIVIVEFACGSDLADVSPIAFMKSPVRLQTGKPTAASRVPPSASPLAPQRGTPGRTPGIHRHPEPERRSRAAAASTMAAGELSRLLDQDGDGAGGDEAAERMERAEIARAQAESDAAEGERRLQVARQQFAEYAQSKATEAAGLGSMIRHLLAACDGVGSAELTKKVLEIKETMDAAEAEARAMASDASKDAKKAAGDTGVDAAPMETANGAGGGALAAAAAAAAADDLDDGAAEAMDEDGAQLALDAAAADLDPSMNFVERAKYIPLRLDMDERKLLRLLEAALHVSEYTDKVDVLTFRSKTQRITKQLKEICAIMCGLVVATDYRAGQELIKDKDFEHNAQFFQRIFEIGRRHKVMNPEKMRSEYGKMIYLLQDSQMADVQELLNFKLVKPMRTAHALLAEKNGLPMLRDGLMHQATAEIMHEGKPRIQVQREIKAKEKAREHLSRRYSHADLSSEEILSVLYSISDNNAYLRFNRDPVDRMIDFLERYFDPKTPGTRVLAGDHDGDGRGATVAQPRAPVHVRHAVDDAVEGGEQRHVQALVPRRGRLAARGGVLSADQHGPGFESRAVGAADEQGDPPGARAVPGQARSLGGQQRGAPRRPQRPQRPHVHRQVHPGAADPEPRSAGGATGGGAVRGRGFATVRGEHVRGRGRVQEDHPGGLFQARLRRIRGG